MKEQRESPQVSISRDDVARRANVSAATVSRVYNEPELVRRETREAVLTAAEELGYAPNKAASSLRRSGSGTIAFVECDRHHEPHWARINQLFYVEALRAIRREMDRTMFQINLMTVGDPAELRELTRRGQFDAVVVFDLDNEDEAEAVASLRRPYALAHHTAHFGGHHNFFTDNYAGGQILGRHMRSRGIERAAYFGNRLETVTPHNDRLRGFADGFAPGMVSVFDQEGPPADIIAAAGRILPDVRSGRFDAVVGLNDFTAVNVARVFLADGIRIPDDVSMAGYDNSLLSYALPFGLTTVDLGLKDVYARAARAAIAAMRGGDVGHARVIPELIPADSVAGDS